MIYFFVIPQFNIPNLRVGTLDSLLSLSDDLVRVIFVFFFILSVILIYEINSSFLLIDFFFHFNLNSAIDYYLLLKCERIEI